jgi:hypothetical protein
MAEIVELQAYQRKTGTRRDISAPAEIVIFPGVRIERQTFSLADRLAKPKDTISRSSASGRASTRDD